MKFKTIVYTGKPYPEEGNRDKWSCIQFDRYAVDLIFPESATKEEIEQITRQTAYASELLEALQEAKELLSNTYDIPDYESPGFMAQDKQSQQVTDMINRLTAVIDKATKG